MNRNVFIFVEVNVTIFLVDNRSDIVPTSLVMKGVSVVAQNSTFSFFLTIVNYCPYD